MRLPRLLRRAVMSAVAAAVVGVVAVTALVLAAPDPRPLLARRPEAALEVTDRHGALLRLQPAPGGERYLPAAPAGVSPHLLAALLAAEDRRFLSHPGVDPIALLRAALQDLRERRVVSGGSTLTMQLARLLDPRPRSLAAKLAQIGLALRLELYLDKQEILAEVLSRAPLGNRLTGFEAAARAYLGKPAAQLSPAEAALLAAVPRAPSRDNPWRDLARLRARRDAILARMARAGALDQAALAAALAEDIVLAADPFRSPAPHFLARAVAAAGSPRGGRLVTTLEPLLQERVEVIVRRHLDELAGHGVSHMAVAVLDVGRGEWLALEGSGGFWDRPGGQQDGTRLPRQPGSALKPFTYAAAFERALSPASVLPDLPAAFTWRAGTWTPRNYDGRFHGPLRARSALACSVNVPAAHVLAAVGPDALLGMLRSAGLSTLAGDAAFYGLGLTLGAGEVRLDELALAYAALLRGGEWQAATSWRSHEAAGVLRRPDRAPPRRICSSEAAAQVVDILADPEARAEAFGLHSVLRLPFPAAVKTGTSEGFRDNWCLGGTREVVVGVWAGNFDRAPMGNVSGVSGAGAVWREVMLAWAELVHPGNELSGSATLAPPPASLRPVSVCALSGLLPGRACPRLVRELLTSGQTPRGVCDWHRPDGRIAWPPRYRAWAVAAGLEEAGASDKAARAGGVPEVLAPVHRDAFVISSELPRRYQRLELRAAVPGDASEAVWLVDGREHARVGAPYTASWELVPGEHHFEIEVGERRSRPVAVTVYGR